MQIKKIALIFLFPIFCFSQKIQTEKYSVDYFGDFYSNFRPWRENGFSSGYQINYLNKSVIYSVNISVGLGLSKNLENKHGYIQAFLESDVIVGKK